MADKPLRFDPIAEARRQWESHFAGAPSAAMAAATSIMRAQQLVLAAVDRMLKPFGLTFARYEVLMLLSFSRRGELPLGKIGERLMVHPTSVTNAIDRLEGSGLVRRVPHPDDGRAVLARITPAGRRRARAATVVLNDAKFSIGDLGEADLDRLTSIIRGLRINAGDFEAGADN